MLCRGHPAWPNDLIAQRHPRCDSSILRLATEKSGSRRGPLEAEVRMGQAEIEVLVVRHAKFRIERQFCWKRLIPERRRAYLTATSLRI
jgi:hypothetical protein